VTAGWQIKLARVSRMDWEEIRARALQELHKRRDLLMHRAGIRQGFIPQNANKAASGQFFFSADELSARAALLQKHLPREATAILAEADDICGHRFRLLGYENLRFTSDVAKSDRKAIDWHLDPVHGKRAPMDPWFRIPFLDFAVVGDHKITWELNRHQHLVTLAKAWLLRGVDKSVDKGDEKYVRELMAQWRNWIQANPYPLGINWGSSLEVAFRSLSWIWVDQILAAEARGSGSASVSAFHGELVPALAFHGRYIERYLSTYFSPNTHLLGEAVALFFLGTLYPQMPRAAHWKESGWRIVLHEAERQVRPDGVYFEQSLYYHVYALDFFLYARWLAARNGVAIPPAFDATLNKMLDVVETLAQAGPAEGFGDDDGGRLFNPRRNHTEQMTDPLALGALLYSRDFDAAHLTEESIWLFGDQAAENLSDTPPRAEANHRAHSVSFPDGGIYLLADAEPYPQAMVIDAGPQGVGRSGHGHADALSLRLTMNGRRWLVDSGSGVYISKDLVDRDAFRGTAAHNTMRVDGADQAVADGPFSWTNLPATITENWIRGKTFTYFVGSHNGYGRLADPVVHRRHVLKIAGDLWLIRDVALGHAQHEVEVRWHFAPDLTVHSTGAGRVEISTSRARSSEGSGEAGLSLLRPEGTIWQSAMEVTRTVLSPAYGALQPAPMVRCHARVALPAELATVLIPRGAGIGQADKAVAKQYTTQTEPRLASMTQGAVQVYELAYRDATHGFFFARGDGAWSFGPWSSDARVLYCRIAEEKLDHLVVIGGTQVAWQGKPLLKAAEPSEFFEWRKRDNVMNAVPGRFSFTALFEALTGQPMKDDLRAGGKSSTASSDRDSSSYAEKH
jgi:hypothetical protein